MTVLNNLRRRSVLFREPIRRIGKIFDLRLVICFLAARYGFRTGRLWRKVSVLDRKSPGEIFPLLLL